jgi:para-aminobenzoate synthetase component 1
MYKIKGDPAIFKRKALAYASKQSSTVCYLDSNEYKEDRYQAYDALLAFGSKAVLKVPLGDKTAFQQLESFGTEQSGEWLFGHLSYDLKNEVEALDSANLDGIAMPVMHFFVPKQLLLIHPDGTVDCPLSEREKLLDAIEAMPVPPVDTAFGIAVKQRIPEEAYKDVIRKLRQHIYDGDVYEINFCQEFFAENTQLEQLPFFNKLNHISQAPFSAYYAFGSHALMCGSPERFMCKRGDKLITQPIKGTIKRGESEAEDLLLKKQLRHSEKDQAENVMIVDLVRNDLSRNCQTGTVKVEELFGIYPFQTVFQMISTVVGTLKTDKTWIDIIRDAYPMGSMTGAPKVRSMQLIEHYEQNQRGLYSGSVGYITPARDFDFNVVIRSVLYNSEKDYLSFQVGGAIVYDSHPDGEYEECLLKSMTMQQALK